MPHWPEYEEIRDTLGDMGYHRTEADHAAFARHEGDNEQPSLTALYVDDTTMAAKSIETINKGRRCLGRYGLFCEARASRQHSFRSHERAAMGSASAAAAGAEAVAATSAGATSSVTPIAMSRTK
jgi:hypothetical protein